MQHYKSLFLVAMLGGVVLCVAGMMTTFENAARRKKSDPNEPRSAAIPPEMRIRVPVSGSRPEGQLESDLRVIRETFDSGSPSFERIEKARRHLNRAADFLKPRDWPTLEAEFKRTPLHPGYRTMLLVLAGASMSEDALPTIAAHWKDHPSKVADALQRNGTSAALSVATKLFRESKSESGKLLLLRSMSRFPEVEVRGFLLAMMNEAPEPAVLKQGITMLRHHRHPDVISALDAFVRGCDPADLQLAKRALNSLTGLKLEGALVRVLDMYLDAELPRSIRDAAGEALAFSRAPFLVPRVIEILRADGSSNPALLSFLNRNAEAEHVAALMELLESVAPGELRDVLESLLDRLER